MQDLEQKQKMKSEKQKMKSANKAEVDDIDRVAAEMQSRKLAELENRLLSVQSETDLAALNHQREARAIADKEKEFQRIRAENQAELDRAAA
jgi:hypothetical protein